MLRHYTVMLAVVCVVIYSWLCTQMIPLLALRTKPALVVPYGDSWSLGEGR